MTLTQTLQIKERFLKFEDMRALDYVEKRWEEVGKPVERWQLVNFLERMLVDLKTQGTGYPKVLLLRKKEIQRNTFTICEPAKTTEPQDGVCPLCAGAGWIPGNNGYAPCACPAGEPHRAKLQRWGMKI
jgi:hypothetical protein